MTISVWFWNDINDELNEYRISHSEHGKKKPTNHAEIREAENYTEKHWIRQRKQECEVSRSSEPESTKKEK